MNVQGRQVVVLWEGGGVTCTCVAVAVDHIEICLVASNVIVDRQVFTDADAASRYALDKMRAYQAL
jgi:hypothetical protein